MNGKLSMSSDDCLWQWWLRKVYSYEEVRGTYGLSRVLLGVARVALEVGDSV